MSQNHVRFTVVSTATFILLGALIAALLALRHHEVGTSFAIGVVWSIGAQGLSWGALEAIAPAAVLRWRYRLIADSTGMFKAVGNAFDRRLGLRGPQSQTSAEVLNKIRRLGVILLAVWIALIAASVLAIQPLDRFFAGRVRTAG